VAPLSPTGRILQSIVRLSCARPALTVFIGVVLAALGAGYSAHSLRLETSKFHLLPLNQGVWSLGLLLVIGSAVTLTASLVVLPTLVGLGGPRPRSSAPNRPPLELIPMIIMGRGRAHPGREAASSLRPDTPPG
jgi:hypothetical protein